MKSQNALLKPIEPLESQSTKVIEDKPTSTARSNVLYAEFSVPPKPLAPHGAIDIDDLVSEFEQSQGNAEAIARGRRWVAKTFYPGHPSVAQLRLQKGWSQAELAKRAETSQPHIARLELGNVDPQISTVKKLAKVLGVPLETMVLAISPGDEQ